MTLALLGTASKACAQPRYRLTPLVKLGFTPNPDLHGTLGINNKGQVVYGFDAGESEIHAWLWLPSADYNLAAGFHDLTTITESDEPAIARDINESGVIVGQSDSISHGVSPGRIAVWWFNESLTPDAYDYAQLGAFSATNAWSGANAVNDEAEPVIVGHSGKNTQCGCSGGSSRTQDVGFRLVFDQSSNTLVELSQSPSIYGGAQDVNTPQGENPLLIVGDSECMFAVGMDPCAEPPDCHPNLQPMWWSPSTPNVLDRLDEENGSVARGINEAEQIAGWGYEGESTCVQRALYWADPGASRILLGGTMPDGQEEDDSRAEAINDASPPQVVGWNESQQGALLWEDPEGTIVVTDLNDSSAIGGCASLWDLQEAHDINDNDWIITWGTNTGSPSYSWAILLTPWPACAVDIVQTGCVNTDDIIAVVGAWGACPIGSICNSDVNGDCVVNTDDLIAVNVAWGCSPCGGGFAGLDPRTLEELIAIILESGAPSGTIADVIEQLIDNWP